MKSLEIQIDRNNVEQQMAFDIVANTNTCLFITGKAGTGKTTFVKRIQEEIKNNYFGFELKKGERLGIIGLPGSGRSTIADLITKVIRPRQGNV